MPKKLLVTSALPYANGSIHLGHLVEYIQTDIIVRFLKLIGTDVLYICASDTHGTPIEVNAAKLGMKPEALVKKYNKEHKEDFKKFFIEFDHFYTTHSKENKELSEHFFTTLKKNGHIYTKTINVIYCEKCGRVLPDRYVRGTCPHCATLDQYGDVCESCGVALKGIDLLDPKCSICGTTPLQKESEHYFFRLSAFSGKLKKWLAENKNLQPEITNHINGWLKKGLEDWNISRDGPYFGFKIPGEKNKYFYVWLDAPIGYISSTKHYTKKWNDYWSGKARENEIIHFIGKDIIYFHFLFWPAMLMGVGFNLPSDIVVHGFLTVNGEKMSKSRGTFFTAQDFLKLYPPEYLRFYYAQHLSKKLMDVDLDFENFTATINNKLIANAANFCYRVLSFAEKNYSGKLDKVAHDPVVKEIEKRIENARERYLAYDIKGTMEEILAVSDLGNAYFQNSEPWKDKVAGKGAVGLSANIIRVLSILLSPVLPSFCAQIQKQFGEKNLQWKDIRFDKKLKVKNAKIVYQKIESDIKIRVDNKASDVVYGVADEVRELGVKVRVAQISGVSVKKKKEGIERLKKELHKNIKKYEHPEILDEYRRIAQKTDVDYSKHPDAITGLLNLIKSNGRLPQINTVVDIYNLVSIESGICMATHDLRKIEGKIHVRLSRQDESFTALGNKIEQLKKGEVVYADDKKVLGRFSKQCEQTLTSLDTKNVLLVAFGNSQISDKMVDSAVKKTCELIVQYNGGSYKIVDRLALKHFPLNLRVGKILTVKDHPNADSLYVVDVDVGEKRQLVAGLKKHYAIDELQGKNVIVCINMKPAKIRGVESKGMLLAAADDQGNVSVLEASKSSPGSAVVMEGYENSSAEITFEEFMKLGLKFIDGKVVWNKAHMHTGVEDVTAVGVLSGAVVR